MFKNFLGRNPLVRRSLLALVVYFSFHAAVLESATSRQCRETRKWPMTQATVSSGYVYATNYSWSQKSNRYCPQLTYKYTINGRDYVGSNRVFDFICWPDAQDFIAQHQPGGIVTIAYNANDVSVSFIPASVREPGW